MSGLAVLFHRDGRPVEHTIIDAMLAAVPYRGPDGTCVRLFDTVGLGHAKMAVTPEEEHEEQPLVSPRTGCVIVADVRLDNRDDLLARLPGLLPSDLSDAELIMRTYESWDIDAATHLLGDFAFAIWDPRTQCLVCARDTSGQRALFYRVDRRTFAAASEIHQLFQDPTVPIAPSEERIRDYLVPRNLLGNEKDTPLTFYEGIYALPAGHLMVIDREALQIRKYWELDPPAELRYRSDDEYADHYRSLFSEVVRSRLRSSHPMGALLSGGLDSSSIVCVAQELYRAGRATDRGFTSFSWLYDGLECDERTLIQDVQMKYGFDAQYIPYGKLTGILHLDAHGFMEAPNMGIREARDAMFGAVAQTGVRVLLTGNIADSCVGGTQLVLDSLLRQRRLRAFWRYFQTYRRNSNESLRKIVVLACIAPLLPLPLQKHIMIAYGERAQRRNQGRVVPFWMPEPLRTDLRERHFQLCLDAERKRRFSNPTRELEYRLLYPPEVSRHLVPWPLETWRPFADRRLHEFLLAVPPEQKFLPHPDTDEFYAGTKQLVRRGLRGTLPESIRTRRSKTVFGSVLDQELKQNWPTYVTAFGPSGHSELSARGYVDQDAFWSWILRLRDEGLMIDQGYLNRMIGLETWLRTFALPRQRLVAVAPPSPVAPESMVNRTTSGPQGANRPDVPAAALHRGGWYV